MGWWSDQSPYTIHAPVGSGLHRNGAVGVGLPRAYPPVLSHIHHLPASPAVPALVVEDPSARRGVGRQFLGAVLREPGLGRLQVLHLKPEMVDASGGLEACGIVSVHIPCFQDCEVDFAVAEVKAAPACGASHLQAKYVHVEVGGLLGSAVNMAMCLILSIAPPHAAWCPMAYRRAT